jgi:hypothetical protein
MKREYVHDCECGLRWKVTEHKTLYGFRDSDSEHCTCGREIVRWNGGHVYLVEKLADTTN